jgi:hypothetical protein
LLIALTAVAMGLRNSVMRKLAISDLTTTVLTLTITGFAAGSSLAGGDNPRHTIGRQPSACARRNQECSRLLVRFWTQRTAAAQRPPSGPTGFRYTDLLDLKMREHAENQARWRVSRVRHAPCPGESWKEEEAAQKA